MKDEVFKKGMVHLQASFPGVEFDPAVIWDKLSEMSDERFMTAVLWLIYNEKQMYPGANIVALLLDASKKDENKMLPGEAFELVLNKVMSIGSYNPQPDFGDPIINKSVSAIGWRQICLSNESQISIVRAQFVKIYESFLERFKHDANNARLQKKVQEMINKINLKNISELDIARIEGQVDKN